MAIKAITSDYTGEHLDRKELFHGNIVIYIGWDHHTMFCAPLAFMVSPDTSFGTIMDEQIPSGFSMHPDFPQIDWEAAEWRLNGEPWLPDRDKTLAEMGVDHKTAIRFATPGLNGIDGSFS